MTLALLLLPPAVVLLALAAPDSRQIPSRTCSVENAVRVDSRTLAPTPVADLTIYRFAEGVLHLQPTDRSEYVYGRLSAASDGERRFTVGNKTVLFDSADGRGALVVHVDDFEVRTLRLTCR